MRILLLAIGISLGSCLHVLAQTTKVFVVKSLEVPVKVIPKPDQNRFPEFREGLIYYTDGKIVAYPLNYSILYGEMQFINSKGDTLALVNEPNLQKVVIGEASFYSLYGNGYLEVIADYTPVKLALTQMMKIIWWERKPLGGYSGNTYMGDLPSLQKVYNQRTNGVMKIAKKVHFSFIDHNLRFYAARKKILLRLFPDHRKKIERYVKEHKINFKNPQDLQQVVAFCSMIAER